MPLHIIFKCIDLVMSVTNHGCRQQSLHKCNGLTCNVEVHPLSYTHKQWKAGHGLGTRLPHIGSSVLHPYHHILNLGYSQPDPLHLDSIIYSSSDLDVSFSITLGIVIGIEVTLS